MLLRLIMKFGLIALGFLRLRNAMSTQHQQEEIKKVFKYGDNYSLTAHPDYFMMAQNQYDGVSLSGGTFHTYRNRK